MISRLSAFKYFCLLEHPTPPFLPFFIQACNPIWGLILQIEPWPNDLLTTTGPNWQWHDDIFFFCYSSLCKKLAQQCVDKRLSPRSSDNWLTYHHPKTWNQQELHAGETAGSSFILSFSTGAHPRFLSCFQHSLLWTTKLFFDVSAYVSSLKFYLRVTFAFAGIGRL